MSEDIFEKQTEQFRVLWHKLMMIDQNLEIKEKFSEFLRLTANEISVIDIVSENPDII